MSLRSLFGRTATAPVDDAILTVRVDGNTVATIRAGDVPCEVQPHVQIDSGATIAFEDSAGAVHRHDLPVRSGWLHLSVRVHPNFGCQADAVVTALSDHPPGTPLGDGDTGIRFQPFSLAEAPAAPDLSGRGLFARGLHFGGPVTPGDILLSCECDVCGKAFIARSFHAGFADVAYFYSASGRYTLTVDAALEGAPAPLSEPDPAAVSVLEARLPPAPDGTRFAYHNPFRCPHCNAPYIDFAAQPTQRPGEYYALYFPDTPPIRFDAASAHFASE